MRRRVAHGRIFGILRAMKPLGLCRTTADHRQASKTDRQDGGQNRRTGQRSSADVGSSSADQTSRTARQQDRPGIGSFTRRDQNSSTGQQPGVDIILSCAVQAGNKPSRRTVSADRAGQARRSCTVEPDQTTTEPAVITPACLANNSQKGEGGR